MKDFYDNITDVLFRQYVEKHINLIGNSDYSFSNDFPILYKYSGMKQYVLDGLLNQKLSTSLVGSFNDIYDSKSGLDKTFLEVKSQCEKKLRDIDLKAEQLGLDVPKIASENMISHLAMNKYRIAYFGNEIADKMGLRASCFSTKNDSILMWSHYADNHRGLCIGYDFNKLDSSELLRSLIFPVSYIDNPANLSFLTDDENNEMCSSLVDATMVISSLCKSKLWAYENEWRVLFCLYGIRNKYLDINIRLKPREIILGNCFFYDYFFEEDGKQRELIKNLLRYVSDNKIILKYCKPKKDKFELEMKELDSERIIEFLNKCIKSVPETDYSVFMNRLYLTTEGVSF